jgi:DNA-binding response OmpR family regulator
MSKILVIDDEHDLADQLKKALLREQHVVETVYDGQSAVDVLSVSDFDLLVLDWMMPRMNGIEVLRWYRSKGKKSPILMLTAKSELDDKETGLDSGADDYLTKPFHLREFTARVRALLRRASTAADNVITCGDVSLDTTARRVLRDGVEVRLEPREFNLFEFLMRHQGQPFTADALVVRVWQSDSEVSPDAVRVYIRGLRKKLDSEGQPSIISTVHGSGYRIDTR